MKLSYLYKNLIIVLRSKEKLMARKPPEASKITLVELLGRKRCVYLMIILKDIFSLCSCNNEWSLG